MPEQNMADQPSPVIYSDSFQNSTNHIILQDPDDELLVHETPRDYATAARQERDRLIAEGEDPDTVVLSSELYNRVLRREDESSEDFVKRYAEELNAMIGRSVKILNDQCVADVVPDGFGAAGGRYFDLGPESGVTKREYREFNQWFSEWSEAGQLDDVPEKWAKFETSAGGENWRNDADEL